MMASILSNKDLRPLSGPVLNHDHTVVCFCLVVGRVIIITNLSSMAKPLPEFTRVTWMNVGWRQVAADL